MAPMFFRLRVKAGHVLRGGGWQVAVPGVIFAASFSLLGFALYRNWSTLAGLKPHVNYLQLALTFVFYTADLTIAVVGWSLIVHRLTGFSDVRKNLKIYCYSNIARRLPGMVWYIIGRAYLYEQQGIAKTVTSVSSVLEMVVIIISGVITYLLALPLVATGVFSNPLVLLAVLVIGLSLTHPRVIERVLARLTKDRPSGTLRYRDTLTWLGIYVVVWLVGGLVLYSGVNVFYPLPPAQLPEVVGAWSLSGVAASLVFLSPSGLGIRELTLSFLLSQYIPAPVAIMVAVGMRLALTAYEVFWAIVTLRL